MNKKLLTRFFALLASLVLVLALAIPCFADEIVSIDDIQAPTQLALTEYYFEDYAEFYSFISSTAVPQILFPIQGSTLTLNLRLSTLIDDVNDDIVSVVYTNETVIIDQIAEFYAIFTESSATLTAYIGTSEPSVENYTIEELNALVTSSPFWVFQELQLPETPEVPDTPDEPTEPPTLENGWYSQIKNIIIDAVFGQDAVLNDSQEFTINQISLWLTLVVILLPLIVGAVILVRCFR